jgi:hypothetical protein
MTAVWEPQAVDNYDTSNGSGYIRDLFGAQVPAVGVPVSQQQQVPTQTSQPVRRMAQAAPANYDPEYEALLEQQRLLARYPVPADTTVAETVQPDATAPQPLPTYLPAAPTTYGHFATPTGVDPMSSRSSDNMIRALGMKSLFGMRFDNPASINTSMDNADVTALSYTPEYRQYMDYLTPLVGYDAAAKAATYHTANALGAGGSLANSAAWVPVTNTMARATADLNAGVGLTGVDTTSELAFPYVGAGQIQTGIGDQGQPVFYAPSGEQVQFNPNLSPAGLSSEVMKLQQILTQPPGALPMQGVAVRGRTGAGAVVNPGGLAAAVTANEKAKAVLGDKLKQIEAKALADKELARQKAVATAALQQTRLAAAASRAGASKTNKVQDAIDIHRAKKQIDAEFPKQKAGAPVAPAPI